MQNTKILLDEKEIPTHFLNINYYLKKYLGRLPDQPLNPMTKKPIKPEDLAPLFPMELIRQEVSLEEKIKILNLSDQRGFMDAAVLRNYGKLENLNLRGTRVKDVYPILEYEFTKEDDIDQVKAINNRSLI